MASPEVSQTRQPHTPGTVQEPVLRRSGQKWKRSLPPQTGQGPCHSPPWVPATLRGGGVRRRRRTRSRRFIKRLRAG